MWMLGRLFDPEENRDDLQKRAEGLEEFDITKSKLAKIVLYWTGFTKVPSSANFRVSASVYEHRIDEKT
jgi:hypothetical protein